jgi:hypothetical protein
MEDAELREAIMDCLPIGGPDRNSGYLDIDGEEVTEVLDTLVAFVKEREQAAYDRGKEVFMSEMKQGLREIIAKREHKEEP